MSQSGRAVALSALLLAAALPALLSAVGIRAAQPMASSAALRLEDLPAGWTSTFVGMADEAGMIRDECSDGEPVVPLSFSAVHFQRGEGVPFLQQNVALFAPGDAERAMRYLVADYTACGMTRDSGPFAAPLPFPTLGDETIALRITGAVQFGTAVIELVAVRRGDAVFLLVQTGEVSVGGVDSALTERLARLTDQRLLLLLSGKGG